MLFLDFLRQFDAADRQGRRLESLEPEHRPDPLLYSPVILLDHVVQVFAGSHLYAARYDSGGFELGEREILGGLEAAADAGADGKANRFVITIPTGTPSRTTHPPESPALRFEPFMF